MALDSLVQLHRRNGRNGNAADADPKQLHRPSQNPLAQQADSDFPLLWQDIGKRCLLLSAPGL